MTTKITIGTRFKKNEAIKGMFINSDGFPAEIIETIIRNMEINKWNLIQMMTRVYEEKLFYLNFVHKDFSLPFVYWDFPKNREYATYGFVYKNYTQYVKPESQFLRLFEDMNSEAQNNTLSWFDNKTYWGMHTAVQILVMAAPEVASASKWAKNIPSTNHPDYPSESNRYDPKEDYRTSENESGKEIDDYELYIDIPDKTFRYRTYDGKSEKWETFTLNQEWDKLSKKNEKNR